MGVKRLLPDRIRVAANTLRQDLSNLRRAVTDERRPPFASRSARRRPAPNVPNPKDGATISSQPGAVPVAPAPAPSDIANRAPDEAIAVFERTGVEVVVGPDQTILEAGLEAGVDLIFSCGLGGCGACMLSCTDGEVEYEDVDATCLLPQDIEEGLCLACVGRPRGRIVLDA